MICIKLLKLCFLGYNNIKIIVVKNTFLANKGMMSLNLDRQIIDDIIKICKKHKYIDKVILFGSRARGDNNSKSDIDLAIYSTKPIMEFIEDIELNTRTLLEYDYTHMETIKDDFFVEQIIKDGIVIYEKCRV